MLFSQRVAPYFVGTDGKEGAAGSGLGEANTASTPDADAASTVDEQPRHNGVEN